MHPTRVRLLIEAAVVLLALLMQGQLSHWLTARRSRMLFWAGNALAALWLFATLTTTTARVSARVARSDWLQWNLGLAILWVMFVYGVFPLVWLARRAPRFDPGRRRLLQSAAAAVPLAGLGFGVSIGRSGFVLKETRIAIPGLPRDLDGLRLAQLTDIHLSPFLSRAELDRAVDMLNETRPHVALVTGDLITARGDPLDDCLRALTRLRAEAGVLGCLGNHEAYSGALDYTASQGARLGIDFLRGRGRPLRFGSATLNIAGVDYRQGRAPTLPRAPALRLPGAVNLLLSHNPNLFPAAARAGFDLTVSGHTHGGQITMEVFDESVTMARFYTPYVQGLFRDGAEALYVSRGIGTVGVPARIGAPPEVTLIILCVT
ncbi:MAG: metallophosphoesterase [Acidobacteria bacterium]|nr:metallophosphoesterase [Acidobacteriota bacterium]